MIQVHLSVIILAAGHGTRMKSSLPKVMQPIGGIPILEHIINTASGLYPTQVIPVIGYGRDIITGYFQKKYTDKELQFVVQENQLGTGDALRTAMAKVSRNIDQVLVLNGDVPLIKVDTIKKLIDVSSKGISLITVEQEKPTGLGRIIRDKNNNILKIVEEKDASNTEKKITEINPGIYLFNKEFLEKNISKLDNKNAQSEYYITDLLKIALDNNYEVASLKVENNEELLGVNNKQELSNIENIYQKKQIETLQAQGVTTISASTLSIRGTVKTGIDVVIDLNVILEGKVELGNNVRIGANVIIKNAVIGDNTKIEPNSIIEESIIDNNCIIGPFARVRTGTKVSDNSKIGNFVETKKAIIGKNSKANHLSYLGDVEIGDNVNIGAGTITCNYDGVNKYKTIIEDNVFIGSGSQLVAPITITNGATIAAGTTVMKNVEKSALILNKKTQDVVDSWKRPEKSKAKE